MPKSRNRKKKSKKKKSDRIFKSKDATITLKGKNLFLKVNRSEEDQKKLNEILKKARPEILLEINNKIERVVDIFSEYNNFILLGALCYNWYSNRNNPTDDGRSELALEYATSFSTSIKDNPINIPNDKVCLELRDLLYDIRFLYQNYVMTEHVDSSYSEIEGKIRFKTIIDSLYMRGNAYQTHLIEIYKELFAGHDDLLRSHYGFDSKDILDTILQLEDSWYCRTILPKGTPLEDGTTLQMDFPHPRSYKRFKEWQNSKNISYFSIDDKQSFIDFFNDNPDLISPEEGSGFLINDPNNFENLYKIRFRKDIHKKVIENICLEFGDNSDFLNPKFKGLPLNDSLIYETPIIKHNQNFYLFAFSLLGRNLFKITEALILKADEEYYNTKFLGNKYSQSRDNYLENKTYELFSKFLNNSKSYQNLKYNYKDEAGNTKEPELDLLVETEKANYIIEIKAGGLSAPSKRGALKNLTNQLKDTVGYGAYQSYRALDHINRNEIPIFYDGDKEITVDKTKKSFRITITLEHLSTYLSNMEDIRALKALDRNVEMAWTCSVFDFMIFSEIIENEDDFIDYLEKRIPLYKDERVEVEDEIDFLGYYLEHGELVDKKIIKDSSSFKLLKTSKAIDDYFEIGGIKPRKKEIIKLHRLSQ